MYRVITLNWQKVLSFYSYMHYLTNLESLVFEVLCLSLFVFKFHRSKMNSFPTASILKITRIYPWSSINSVFINIIFHLIRFFSEVTQFLMSDWSQIKHNLNLCHLRLLLPQFEHLKKKIILNNSRKSVRWSDGALPK